MKVELLAKKPAHQTLEVESLKYRFLKKQFDTNHSQTRINNTKGFERNVNLHEKIISQLSSTNKKSKISYSRTLKETNGHLIEDQFMVSSLILRVQEQKNPNSSKKPV